MLKVSAGKTDNAEKHFFNLYKIVLEREPYLSNEAKIVQYGAILRYFTKFLQQKGHISHVVETILYQIDVKLGDIYYEEALQNQDNGRYFLATAYYNQALAYAHQIEDKNRVLLALRNIYYFLDDEDALFRVEESWAENHEKKDKFSAYMLLAQSAEQPQIKTIFLTKALAEVMEQDESFYTKYQNTLDVCSKLTALYELLGEKDKAKQMVKLRENTLKLLN